MGLQGFRLKISAIQLHCKVIFFFYLLRQEKMMPTCNILDHNLSVSPTQLKTLLPFRCTETLHLPSVKKNAFSTLWRRQRRKHKKVSLPSQIWKQPLLHFSAALYHQQTIGCIHWLTLSLDASGRGSNFSGNTFHLYNEIKLTFRFGRMPPQLRNACLKSECQSFKTLLLRTELNAAAFQHTSDARVFN